MDDVMSNALAVLLVFSMVQVICCSAAEMASKPDDYGVHGRRTKRQLPPLEEGNQVIDNIFQIPISTLNAVGSLIKSTRPIVRRTRERIQQYYNDNGQQTASASQQQQQQQQQYQQDRPQYSYNNRPNPVVQYNRPYYYYGGNRKKQQRGEPPAEGRHHRRVGHDHY